MSRRSSRRRFLATVVDHFDETGEWPSVPLLQNALVEQHDGSDARREARRLPPRLGRTASDNKCVVLTFSGVCRAFPNHEIVEDFERSLPVLSRRYRRRGNKRIEATVSVGNLIAELDLSEDRARRALSLFEVEGLTTQQPDGRTFVINPEMCHYVHVRYAADYIKIRARRERRRCVSRKANALSKATFGDRKGIRKVVIGALAIVLAAGLIWLGQHVWVGAESDPSHRATTPHQPKPSTKSHAVGG